MMNERHPLDLVLAYEELDAAQRAAVDEHLAACASCRTLLGKVQAAEAAAPGAIELDEPLAGLSAETRADAEASREALLQRIRRDRKSRAPWLTPARLLIAVPLAAALLVAIGLKDFIGRRAEPFGDLRLAPAVVTRDAERELQPGQPVSIRFTPDRDGWPVVVHADETGVRLLCPTAELAGWPAQAGLPTVLPPPGSGVSWNLASDGAAERWWVALSADPVDAPAALAALLATAAPDEVTGLLSSRFGAAAELPRR